MSDPFIGEIRLFGFPRVPSGWLACNGLNVSISTYETLYTAIGTIYGGDGVNVFALPDLQGRVAIGQGQGSGQPTYTLGARSGEEQHTLIENEMPSHNHGMISSTDTATTATPGPAVHLATASAGTLYAPPAGTPSYDLMAPCLTTSGGNVAHDNMMPTVVGNYCICYAGIFPTPA